jgi:hypothetical protein
MYDYAFYYHKSFRSKRTSLYHKSNKNRFKIIDSFDEIDEYFVDFEKIICVKKGIYERAYQAICT